MVHEWLVTNAGSERVLAEMLRVLPTADVATLIDTLPESERGFLHGRHILTSILDRLPVLRKRHRLLLPLMPFAIEQLDVTGYDVVVSSSHAVAKGVLTGPDQLHLCMCYSPIRYAWDLQHEYLAQAGLGYGPTGLFTRRLLSRIREWDVRTAANVDAFIAISHFIARRIEKAYRRSSTVVYPPVDVDTFTPAGPRGDHYVTASRFVPYKRLDVIVDAFRSMPDRHLVVIGDGPEAARIRARAGRNVTLLGHVSRAELVTQLRAARAFLFCAVEDFGIAPLEAQAVGTPVIAYAGGALPETIPGLECDEPCGVLFDAQSAQAVVEAVRTFEAHATRISHDACRRNAERFSPARFRREFGDVLARELDRHQRAMRRGRSGDDLARQ